MLVAQVCAQLGEAFGKGPWSSPCLPLKRREPPPGWRLGDWAGAERLLSMEMAQQLGRGLTRTQLKPIVHMNCLPLLLLCYNMICN